MLRSQALSDSVGDGDAWKKTCATILDALYAHLEKDNMKGVFDRPVDTVAIPNYLNGERPADFGPLPASYSPHRSRGGSF